MKNWTVKYSDFVQFLSKSILNFLKSLFILIL